MKVEKCIGFGMPGGYDSDDDAAPTSVVIANAVSRMAMLTTAIPEDEGYDTELAPATSSPSSSSANDTQAPTAINNSTASINASSSIDVSKKEVRAIEKSTCDSMISC
jgi:hypothetical protein